MSFEINLMFINKSLAIESEGLLLNCSLPRCSVSYHKCFASKVRENRYFFFLRSCINDGSLALMTVEENS